LASELSDVGGANERHKARFNGRKEHPSRQQNRQGHAKNDILPKSDWQKIRDEDHEQPRSQLRQEGLYGGPLKEDTHAKKRNDGNGHSPFQKPERPRLSLTQARLSGKSGDRGRGR
jgi:hypothetical protein